VRCFPHIVCIGGEDHALRIPYLVSLRERQFKVTAVSSGSGAAFEIAGIAHRTFLFDRFTSGLSDLKACRVLRRLIDDIDPDVVHSFDTKPNLLVPFSIRSSRQVVRTINGLGWVFSSASPRAVVLRPLYCALQRAASIWTSATVFQNQEDLTLFQRFKLLGRSPGKVIASSGIDTGEFLGSQDRAPSPETLRNQLDLQGAEVVIYVGRVTREKGIPTLLDAVRTVISQRPKAKFVLVGPLESEGPFAVTRATIEKLSPHVMALGRRQDVPALLAMADVFAFPTEYREGVPRVLLEAGLSGLPIVATRMPGCTDVVQDGMNGRLVQAGNAKELAKGIVAMLSDSVAAKEMGKRSVEIVRQRFELARVVDGYCAIYQAISSASETTELPETKHTSDNDARLELSVTLRARSYDP
jgi:glycosyltransferase involved in cell wall biosynthesis